MLDNTRVCGVPDHLGGGDCKWPFPMVFVHAEGRLGEVNVRDAVEQALNGWNAVCGLKLTMATNAQTAHIVVTSGRIDGPSGVLAWSELPCGFTASQWRQLKQQYDTGEIWTIADNPPSGRIDAVRVICHELGHAIGISHIHDGNLMAPMYSTSIRWPQRGDIAEARARYGLPTPTIPPPGPGLPPAPDGWERDPDHVIYRRKVA